MVDYGPQAPINTTSHCSTAQMGVAHAPCCLLVLTGGSVVTCSLPVVCCIPGTCLGCVLVQGRKPYGILPVRTYKIMPIVLKPGESSHPPPPKKKLGESPRAPEGTDRARTSTNVSLRAFPVSSTWRVTQKCSYEEKCSFFPQALLLLYVLMYIFSIT